MKLKKSVSILLSTANEQFQLRQRLKLTDDELLYAMADAVALEPDDENPEWVAMHVCQRLLLEAGEKNDLFEGVDVTKFQDFVEDFVRAHRYV